MKRGSSLSRRSFLAGACAATLATRMAQAAPGRPNASGRFATGHVGLGQRGAALVGAEGFDPRAFFDVDAAQIRRAAPSARAGARVMASYAELLALGEVDAVVIATPDHWHTRLAIAAMEAGKDVYIESPCVWQHHETRRLLDTARAWGAVAQSGDTLPYTRAAALLKEKLAPIPADAKLEIHCRAPRNPVGGNFDFPATPEGFDWVQWLGHAAFRAYNPDYAHENWRFMQDWGGGHVRAIGTQQIATLLWALNIASPTSVMVSAEAKPQPGSLWDCSPEFRASITIDGRATLHWEQADLPPDEAPCVMRVTTDAGVFRLSGLDERAILRLDENVLVEGGWQDRSPTADWSQSMLQRSTPRLALETACAASSITQLAVIAGQVASPLNFDFSTGISDHPAANRLLHARPGDSNDAAR